MKDKQTTMLSLRVPDEYLKAIEEICEKEYRCRTNVMLKFIRDGIRKWQANNKESFDE